MARGVKARKWETGEVETLRRMMAENYPHKAIAERLGRTVSQIRDKWKRVKVEVEAEAEDRLEVTVEVAIRSPHPGSLEAALIAAAEKWCAENPDADRGKYTFTVTI